MKTGLGNDGWANDCRATIRKGLEERTFVNYGGLTVGRVGSSIILGNGNWVEFPISFKREAHAVIEFQRITDGLNHGQSISELLPTFVLPDEIVNAFVQ